MIASVIVGRVMLRCIGLSPGELLQASRLNPEVAYTRSRLARISQLHAKALSSSAPEGIARYLLSADNARCLGNVADHSIIRVAGWVVVGGGQSADLITSDGDQRHRGMELIEIDLPSSASVGQTLIALLAKRSELIQGQHRRAIKPVNPEDYILKTGYCQAYMFDHSDRLIDYAYVRQCLARSEQPLLTPILLADACKTMTQEETETKWVDVLEKQPTKGESSQLIYQELGQLISNWRFDNDDQNGEKKVAVDSGTQGEPDLTSWQMRDCFLSVKVRSAELVSRITGDDKDEDVLSSANTRQQQPVYCVRVGLCHGGQSLIEYQTTDELPGNNLKWNKWLSFHILLSDIPPSARLCLVLLRVTPLSSTTITGCDRRSAGARSINNKIETPVGWTNINFFSHTGLMISGPLQLNLWPPSSEHQTTSSNHIDSRFRRLYPKGCCLISPRPEYKVQIEIHNPERYPIRRPRLDPINVKVDSNSATITLPQQQQVPLTSTTTDVVIRRCLLRLLSSDDNDFEDSDSSSSSSSSRPFSSTSVKDDQFSALLVDYRNDPLRQLTEQDKIILWHGRDLLSNLTLALAIQALAALVESIDWTSKEAVADLYNLLDSFYWRKTTELTSSNDAQRSLQIEIALRLLATTGLVDQQATVDSTSICGRKRPRRISPVKNSATNQSQQRRIGSSVVVGGCVDQRVRHLAVHWLAHLLTESELTDFCLQLVQCLQTEPYLDNPLTAFLLHRALIYPTSFGLTFYWRLRSHLDDRNHRIRFALILEALLAGSGPLLDFLARQSSAINRLGEISRRLAGGSSPSTTSSSSASEIRQALLNQLRAKSIRLDLQWLTSPFSLSHRLGRLEVDQCDVKVSKKKPLWLVWRNSDPLLVTGGEGSDGDSSTLPIHYRLIYKQGDDLRQDALALFCFKLMDRIWSQDGLYMCLQPYGCLATGPMEGLIEVVRDARTIMSIQRDQLSSALQIDPTRLVKWLASQSSRQSFDRLVDNFTRSLAGYCVGTFVLGIRDRHPDNIMIDTNGRLFHIDFGHILDNKKKKFGITRERCPFILIKDFVKIVQHWHPDRYKGDCDDGDESSSGSSSQVVDQLTSRLSLDSPDGKASFKAFVRLCDKAYLSLRRQSSLLMTSLTCLIPAGLPELSSLDDLLYVRQSLAVDSESEQTAVDYFNAKLCESIDGALLTKIDWVAHYLKGVQQQE